MKIAKRLFFGGSGLLALLVLAGCINPISPLPASPEPERGSGSNAADWRAPFTITLHINTDGSARAAGLTGNTIKGAAHNYVQLILAQGGNIAAFADNRLASAEEDSVSLSVTVDPGKTYDILLLAGHWEHTGYTYEAAPPTLLAAGLTSKEILAGENSVMIQMNPLVVDTKFTKGAKTVEAETEGVFLDPGEWNLEWTISQGASQTNGFTGLLAAQEKTHGSPDTSTLFKNKSVVMEGNKRWESADIRLSGNQVTLALGKLAEGEAGSYNFNLEYAPFSVNERAGWNGFSAINQKNGVPVWIIRNGVNDRAQDGETDFSAPANWSAGANGNGAVGFTVPITLTVTFPPVIPPTITPAMLPVAGGTFQMGSDRSGPYFQENPIHQVTVSSFLMGNYEVTQKEWTSVMKTTATDLLDLRNILYPPTEQNSWKVEVLYGEGADYPIYYVTWYEAVAYCNALSEQEGLTPAYTIDKNTNPWTVTCDFSAPGYRLPTEAEWEYAARGGNTGESYTYSGSNTLAEVAWYSGTSGGNTHPVGGKKPNGLGLYDMSGNVNEWCWDWSQPDYYTANSAVNPKGPDYWADPNGNSFRTTRGGDFIDGTDNNRTTDRGGIAPHARFRSLGFRVVRTQP
jgi:formylglycine-generating enzyme required for sulfatase activity